MIYLKMYFERNRYAQTSSGIPLLRKPRRHGLFGGRGERMGGGFMGGPGIRAAKMLASAI